MAADRIASVAGEEPKPGLRDELITESLAEELAGLNGERIDRSDLDPEEAPERLAQFARSQLRRVLDPRDSSEEQVTRLNRSLDGLGDGEVEKIASPPQVLTGIKSVTPIGSVADLPPKPATPFSQSDLLVNAAGQPSIGSELKAELASADRVDLICAFVIWSGVRHLRDALASVVERGGRVRVITTTYMGATEKKAVDELHRLGADVRVAFDARTTKLHAKAWLLERESSLTTAYVGSSNLSHTALFDGLEWNVRLSTADAPHVIDRVRMTFESHWESEHFEVYDPDLNGTELIEALGQHDRRSLGEASTIDFSGLDVRPYPHQERMLEQLQKERQRHGRHRNLVVAATGTGKTVVAALDYRQLLKANQPYRSLLFVAHRESILSQALSTYRAVLRDGSFGEVHGDGRVATGEHQFAMIQSLSEDWINQVDPSAFDVVVIDEFHHAAAPTYRLLLERLQPEELLGLTATPERMDGQDVTEWFGGRIAVELRLWEAIDQGFLVPFQYFGVADDVDLSDITWQRGGYVVSELSELYTGDDIRVGKLLKSIEEIVGDPQSMRALGFCVSVDHARYMARKFSEAGLESSALTGEDPTEDRRQILGKLARGELRCVFSVDVLGEGVDVPDVDTVLLLRPTQSATVFTQQLGRGLRRAEGKSHLTVIDLIGQHRREFRFDRYLGTILDRRHGSVRDQVEQDFPFLPAGSTMDLDRVSRETILDNLKASAHRSRPRQLAADLRDAGPGITLGQFLDRYDHEIDDIYRGGRSWTDIQRAAGFEVPDPVDPELERLVLKNVSRLTHIDDPTRTAFYRSALAQSRAPGLEDLGERDRRLLTMLAWGLGSGSSKRDSLAEFLGDIWREPTVKSEIDALLELLDLRSDTLPVPEFDGDVPLTVHARYSREEVVAALNFGKGIKPKVTQSGVLWVPDASSDLFFIDLHKAARDYSPTTMYRDYAINRELFHWESQSRQAPHQPSVQRYIEHRERNTNVLLFVREQKSDGVRTMPFHYLGPVDYVSHEGEYPVQFVWRLRTPMPVSLFETAQAVAAA